MHIYHFILERKGNHSKIRFFLKHVPCRYQCPHCEKRFRSHSVYQNHVRVHTGQKQYVCTYCGKAFMQRSHLKRHTATHTGERNHVCPVCSKTFIEPGDVRKHMRTHNKETSAGAVSGVRIAKENSQETHPLLLSTINGQIIPSNTFQLIILYNLNCQLLPSNTYNNDNMTVICKLCLL